MKLKMWQSSIIYIETWQASEKPRFLQEDNDRACNHEHKNDREGCGHLTYLGKKYPVDIKGLSVAELTKRRR